MAQTEMSRSYAGLATGEISDKFVLVEGRRGTSKTRSILSLLVMRGLMSPGRRALLCRSTRTRLSDTVLATLAQQVLPAFGQPLPAGSPSGWHTIPLSTGSVLIPMGLDDPQRAQSLECADIYVSEGVELATAEDVTTLAGALRQADQPGRQCIVDCNPGAPRHWLNEIAEPFSDRDRIIVSQNDYSRMVEHNRRPSKRGWKRIVTTWQDNPGYWDYAKWDWTELGREYRQTLDSLTGHWLARWRDGRWVAAEGTVFPEFNDAVHLVDDFTPPADWPWYVGWDPGFAHPTGMPWVTVSPTGDIFVADEIYEGGKSVQEHAEKVLKMVAGRTVREWFGDPHEFFSRRAQGESCDDQCRKAGLPSFRPWANAPKHGMVESLRELLRNASAGRHPGLFVMRRCVNTTMEFQSWAFKRTASGELPPGDDAYEDRNNHLVGDPLVGMVATGDLLWHDPSTRGGEMIANAH